MPLTSRTRRLAPRILLAAPGLAMARLALARLALARLALARLALARLALARLALARLALARLALTGLALTGLALEGCSSPTGVTRDYAFARRRWIEAGIRSYEVTVGRGCFCPPDYTRAVVVRVRDGQVESRRYADTGEPVADVVAPAYPTVDELFAIVARARGGDAAFVEASFDAALGYPLSVSIDWQAQMADDESFYGMRDLHAID